VDLENTLEVDLENTLSQIALGQSCQLCSLVPNIETKGQPIFNVNILGGSSSVLELLEAIGHLRGLKRHVLQPFN
jgi:hypothetical protein